MGHQIIVQPDGLLCVWSTIVDDFVLTDATGQELTDYYVSEAASRARADIVTKINAVLSGQAETVYHQFTMSYEQAEATRRWRHEGGPPPPD